MENEIMVALLGLIGTAMGTVGGIMASNKLVNHRLARLEAKMDRHNNFMERLAIVEQKLTNDEHRLEEIEHDIY